MDVLVSLATSCAYFYSAAYVLVSLVNPEADAPTFFDTSAMLITFVLLGKYFETLAKGKVSESISQLMNLKVENRS